MVPDGLGAGLGDRERYAWQSILDGIATVSRTSRGGIFYRVVQHAPRQRGRAVGRENLDAEAGITLGQLGGHRSQLPLVLVDVLAIDHQQRFFVGERVRAHAVARLEVGWRGGQATLIRRNGTVSISGFFGADQRQLVTQFGSLGGIDGGVGGPRENQSHRGSHEGVGKFHLCTPACLEQGVDQKVVFSVR
ncbi:hypothetical protein D3C87_870410 [compost metagenome]